MNVNATQHRRSSSESTIVIECVMKFKEITNMWLVFIGSAGPMALI